MSFPDWKYKRDCEVQFWVPKDSFPLSLVYRSTKKSAHSVQPFLSKSRSKFVTEYCHTIFDITWLCVFFLLQKIYFILKVLIMPQCWKKQDKAKIMRIRLELKPLLFRSCKRNKTPLCKDL